MTTEKKSTTETTEQDNKAVFAPLAKYAVVAVMMASLIVTTAIMLDKQLNTVEEKIAAIESEVAQMHTIDTHTVDTTSNNTTVEMVAPASETNTTEIKVTEKTETAAAPISKQITETPLSEATVSVETTPVIQHKTEQTPNFTTAKIETTVQTRQTPVAMDNQARIEAYKLEQKQHMAEMFARIRTLESQQLDQYKVSQDRQITRLRDQLKTQQQLIERLVSRNQALFEMRAATVQKNQSNREQVLNRI